MGGCLSLERSLTLPQMKRGGDSHSDASIFSVADAESSPYTRKRRRSAKAKGAETAGKAAKAETVAEAGTVRSSTLKDKEVPAGIERQIGSPLKTPTENETKSAEKKATEDKETNAQLEEDKGVKDDVLRESENMRETNMGETTAVVFFLPPPTSEVGVAFDAESGAGAELGSSGKDGGGDVEEHVSDFVDLDAQTAQLEANEASNPADAQSLSPVSPRARKKTIAKRKAKTVGAAARQTEMDSPRAKTVPKRDAKTVKVMFSPDA